VDIFVANDSTPNFLYHNNGDGTFKDIGFPSGTALNENGSEQGSMGVTLGDYNHDGRLDLFVGNYVAWSREIDFQVDNRLVGIGRAYGRPMNFPGAFPRLYRNDGNGHFSDVSAQAGVQIKNKATGLPMAKTLGVAPVDLDGDGWMDLVVANDTVQNFVFHNERNGTFKEIGPTSGIAFDSYGGARGGSVCGGGGLEPPSAPDQSRLPPEEPPLVDELEVEERVHERLAGGDRDRGRDVVRLLRGRDPVRLEAVLEVPDRAWPAEAGAEGGDEARVIGLAEEVAAVSCGR